jgi:hypothetical protein
MTTPHHLDRQTVAKLLAGTLPPAEARRWAEHLDAECAECEALLAADGPADALDGLADEALAAHGAHAEAARDAGNDLEFARIQRAVRGRTPVRRFAAFAAIAAAALLAGGLVLKVAAPPRQDWDGMKGFARTQGVPARLRFAVQGAGDERGASGQTLPAGASLLFRVEVGAPAYVAVLRAGDGEPFFTGHAEQPGALDVVLDGAPAAYPLDGLQGTQRFVLVASPTPITPADLRAAAAIAQAGTREDSTRAGLTLDVVEVTVR